MTVFNPDVLSLAPTLAARYRSGEINAAEYASRYVLLWQWARHGRRLAQRRSRFDDKPNGETWFSEFDTLAPAARLQRLIDIFQRYELRGVSVRITTALLAWLRGEWQIMLYEKVPSVREVLSLQATGRRPVTVIADYPRLLAPVLEKPEAFSFICHDLAHAWQFFHQPEQCAAQQRFAQLLEAAIDSGMFTEPLADPVFSEKFDYLSADMNTHVFHSLQYLRAILLEFHLKAECRHSHDQVSATARAQIERCLAHFSEVLPLQLSDADLFAASS